MHKCKSERDDLVTGYLTTLFQLWMLKILMSWEVEHKVNLSLGLSHEGVFGNGGIAPPFLPST
jgi:hypothetical protein